MNFLWYDLETFGIRPAVDRIAEFSALRTNGNFELVEGPVTVFGKLSPDYLPDPLACIVTGLTPQEVNAKGVCEAEMARTVNTMMMQAGTCALGYNSISFDDEFIRNLMYRNFYDPYLREWSNGNSRWDMLGLARATRDLRPEGIEWPQDDDGKPSLRLELLVRANGLEHENPHEALSDVYATVALARLIRDKQPRLFEWAYNHRTAAQIRPLISLDNPEPLVHTTGKGTTLVLPLVADVSNKNRIYFFDLRQDPADLLELPEDEVCRRVFTPGKELEAEGVDRIHLWGVGINRCPFLAPRGVLSGVRAGELGVDLKAADEHWKRLRETPNLLKRLYRILEMEHSQREMGGLNALGGSGGTGKTGRAARANPVDDTDLQIYSAFFPDGDKELMRQVRETAPDELPNLQLAARDKRFPEMLRRYIARSYPHVLKGKAADRWKSFCASRILFQQGSSNALAEFHKRLEKWKMDEDLPAKKKVIIKSLEEYGDYLEREFLQ